ncbi:hypothetical protein [Pelagibius marinus]|uniref:hypothetical protein n=1 Tax=Pelagibius marinus TaxID=2762760 RepID=UPI0018721B70|nr:hypothetical protein [Pelagibius marinus]
MFDTVGIDVARVADPGWNYKSLVRLQQWRLTDEKIPAGLRVHLTIENVVSLIFRCISYRARCGLCVEGIGIVAVASGHQASVRASLRVAYKRELYIRYAIAIRIVTAEFLDCRLCIEIRLRITCLNSAEC